MNRPTDFRRDLLFTDCWGVIKPEAPTLMSTLNLLTTPVASSKRVATARTTDRDST